MSLGQSIADQQRYDPARIGMYGAEPGEMTYAECPVTIPIKHHASGELESPFEFWIIRRADDPQKHIILKPPEPIEKTAFFSRVRAQVGG